MEAKDPSAAIDPATAEALLLFAERIAAEYAVVTRSSDRAQMVQKADGALASARLFVHHRKHRESREILAESVFLHLCALCVLCGESSNAGMNR